MWQLHGKQIVAPTITQQIEDLRAAQISRNRLKSEAGESTTGFNEEVPRLFNVTASLTVDPSSHAPSALLRLKRIICRFAGEKVLPDCVGKVVLLRPVMYDAVAWFAKDMPSIKLSSKLAMWMSRLPAIEFYTTTEKKFTLARRL